MIIVTISTRRCSLLDVAVEAYAAGHWESQLAGGLGIILVETWAWRGNCVVLPDVLLHYFLLELSLSFHVLLKVQLSMRL